MICRTCNREVEKPLVLHDGRLVCPFCTKMLASVNEFRVTGESEEYYNLARICYLRWLEKPSEKTKQYLDRCVEYCVRAAHEGHPKAGVFLGYLYEKGYAEENRGRIEQCRIAYGYYTAICFGEYTAVKTEEGIKGYREETVREIKRQAAKRLLAMLSSLSASAGETGAAQKWMDYPHNRSRVLKLYPTLGDEGERVTSVGVDREQHIYVVLHSCFSTVRAPLFGVVGLENDELKALFARDKESGKPTLYRMIDMGLELKHIPCDSRGAVDESSAERFQALTNRKLIGQYLGDLGKGGGYLYFFSTQGKHAYLNKNTMLRVADGLKSGGFSLVKQLINKGGQTEYTFFDDDVVCFKSGFSYAKAVERLVEDVIVRAEEI